MTHLAHTRSLDAASAAIRRNVRSQPHSVLAWWHLLSLDAPCVAALWTVLFARVFQVWLPWTAPLALALAVWMLYAADRIADAAAGKGFEERHRFHQRHRVAIAFCWLCCAPVLLLLVLGMPHGLRDGWLLLGVPLAVYVGAVHVLQLHPLPKEPLIGLFFGVAVAMPLLCSGVPPLHLAPDALLFALLCWMNCAAITTWEVQPNGYLDPVTRFLGRQLAASAVVIILLSLCLALGQAASRPISVAVIAGAALLLTLRQHRTRLSQTHVRALADAALVAPVAAWLLLARHMR